MFTNTQWMTDLAIQIIRLNPSKEEYVNALEEVFRCILLMRENGCVEIEGSDINELIAFYESEWDAMM